MADARIAKPVTEEIATVVRDTTRRFFGRTLTNEDDTLVTRGGAKGLRIYDELKRDCHALAVLNKRKLAVIARPWEITPASESRRDKRAADLIRDMVDGMQFDRICMELLDATLKGYSVGELMPEVRPAVNAKIDSAILVKDVIPRSAQRFVFDVDSNIRLLTIEAPMEGVELPERKFVVHRSGGTDSPYGLGIGSALFWPVFFKRQGVGFWLSLADKYGMPTAVGKYSNKEDKAALEEALAALAQNFAITVPEGTVVDLLESARAASGDVYDKLIRYLDEQMSEAVLGETMSTTSKSSGIGSSQADVHNEVRIELAKADADLLSDTINSTLVKWVIDWNMPGAGYPKIYRDFEEPEDLDRRADRDTKVVGMGYRPTDKYILDTYGEGWERTAPADAPPPIVDDAQSQFAEGGEEQDEVDLQAEQLASAAAEGVAEIVSFVEVLAGEAASLEDLRDRILDAYGHIPVEKLRMAMSQGFAAAQAGGRFSVSLDG